MKACAIALLVLLTVGFADSGGDVFAQAAQAPAPKPNSGAAPHVAIAKKAAGQEHRRSSLNSRRAAGEGRSNKDHLPRLHDLSGTQHRSRSSTTCTGWG